MSPLTPEGYLRPGALPTIGHDEVWRLYAQCAGGDPEIWFPRRGGDSAARAAIAWCANCRAIEDCLRCAIDMSDRLHGVWGGATVRERRPLRRLRVAALSGDGAAMGAFEVAVRVHVRKVRRLHVARSESGPAVLRVFEGVPLADPTRRVSAEVA